MRNDRKKTKNTLFMSIFNNFMHVNALNRIKKHKTTCFRQESQFEKRKMKNKHKIHKIKLFFCVLRKNAPTKSQTKEI